MVIGCGNFGALPQPPLAGSNEASIPAVAVASRSGVGSSVPASSRDWSISPWTSRPPAASTSARCSRHARSTPSSTWRNEGMPWRGSSG